MARPKQADVISEADLFKALIKHDGVYSDVAKQFGVRYEAVYDRVKNSPRLQHALSVADAQMVDASRKVIQKKIRKGDDKNARWFMERRAKGFSNRTEIGVTAEDLYALVATLGGDVEKMKELQAILDAPPGAPLTIEGQVVPAAAPSVPVPPPAPKKE